MPVRSFWFYDTETTGTTAGWHEMLSLAAVRLDPRTLEELDVYHAKIIPTQMQRADAKALEVNGYTEEKWKDARPLREVLSEVGARFNNAQLGGHNVLFDDAMLRAAYKALDRRPPWWDPRLRCTMQLSLVLLDLGLVENVKLSTVCAYLGIPRPEPHDALEDTRAAAEVYRRLRRAFSLDRVAAQRELLGDPR